MFEDSSEVSGRTLRFVIISIIIFFLGNESSEGEGGEEREHHPNVHLTKRKEQRNASRNTTTRASTPTVVSLNEELNNDREHLRQLPLMKNTEDSTQSVTAEQPPVEIRDRDHLLECLLNKNYNLSFNCSHYLSLEGKQSFFSISSNDSNLKSKHQRRLSSECCGSIF